MQLISRMQSALLVSFWCLLSQAAWGQEAAKQGASLLKVDVMAVLAHPDDETGMAAALASLALGDGSTVANIYCTRGEGGGNMVGTQWGPSLGVLREAELRDCLNLLGIRYCFFLDQRDWAYTESMAATLRAWDKNAALERLVRYIRALQPEVMVTMNPTPNPGQHGHHQSAAILAIEAFSAARDPNRFPDQIRKEGLTVWQPRKLYSTGSLGEFGVEMAGTRVVGERPVAAIVGDALSHHRSQGFGRMRGSPWLSRPRWFTLIRSVTPFAKETSFFDGLPVDGLVPPIMPPPERKRSGAVEGLTARLIPRPAIERYESWVSQFGVEHILMDFLPDVPVIVDEWNTVHIEVENASTVAREAEVSLTAGDSVELSEQPIRRVFPVGKTVIPIPVRPQELGDESVTVTLRSGAGSTKSEGRLHPVPIATIERADRLPDVGLGESLRRRLKSLPIGMEQRVQGRVEGPEDSRAEVQVAHDGERLAVEVRVWDDVIVSNIRPNDVRGHWRSDSVEICVDPVGGSEDSFNCFKVGIFPFVGDLGAQGSRDADANQGPLSETAPGTRVSSQRLPDGYLIKATIPFEEVGFEFEHSSTLGFNVIVYDGDKRDAAPGENINESRIAWSPRSGVQGRPEDWGRIRLAE